MLETLSMVPVEQFEILAQNADVVYQMSDVAGIDGIANSHSPLKEDPNGGGHCIYHDIDNDGVWEYYECVISEPADS
jgi:hypothetical protein